MASSPRRHDEDRLFVRDGWRHYRRRYSLGEVRWGFAVLALLLAVGGWVAYRGAHPDPTLFAAPLAGTARRSGPEARGPLPRDLAGPGWREGKVSRFNADNLYEKINGRADYYKSFGFEQLYYLSLSREGGASTAVDIELYDLGQPQNALGAYAGERGKGVESKLSESGLSHFARNALMLTHGRYYARVIGSDESPAVKEQLARLEAAFSRSLPSAPLPWGYALFVGQMKLAPAKVSYIKENAFSFGFARDVYTARQDDETTALFIVATQNHAAARRLAKRLQEGFSELGNTAEPLAGVSLFADRYLGSLSGATTVERWVVGVYRAKDRDTARDALARLRGAAEQMPQALRDRAVPAQRTAESPGGQQ